MRLTWPRSRLQGKAFMSINGFVVAGFIIIPFILFVAMPVAIILSFAWLRKHGRKGASKKILIKNLPMGDMLAQDDADPKDVEEQTASAAVAPKTASEPIIKPSVAEAEAAVTTTQASGQAGLNVTVGGRAYSLVLDAVRNVAHFGSLSPKDSKPLIVQDHRITFKDDFVLDETPGTVVGIPGNTTEDLGVVTLYLDKGIHLTPGLEADIAYLMFHPETNTIVFHHKKKSVQASC